MRGICAKQLEHESPLIFVAISGEVLAYTGMVLYTVDMSVTQPDCSSVVQIDYEPCIMMTG
jgi:hypothetical protein